MTQTYILGKDEALETSITTMQTKLKNLGFDIVEVSWLNPVPNVWSVHIHDKKCPACFTNGKGASKDAALASALGEFFERLATNYFFADFYLGEQIANDDFVHYPNEKWFPITSNSYPKGLLTPNLWEHYAPEADVDLNKLVDIQSNNIERGICALPFTKQSDKTEVYFPVNIIGNLYVSNGMSAGNSQTEARTQALSECFERYIKNRIIAECLSLPEIPNDILTHYPKIYAAINELEKQGFPITCFDASLGGQYPVICVTLFNPDNGGCFASFGAHPRFEVALERTVTELLQGRSLKELDIFPSPSFDNDEVADQTNLETHFIDSSGLISWDLFKKTSDFPFVHWNYEGSTEEEYLYLLDKFHQLGADVYIADYNHLGTYACRILVPGFSEIYPTYELAWMNNNRGQTLRLLIQEWLHTPTQLDLAQTIVNEIDELAVDEFQPLDQLLGISVDANSPWSTLRTGELRCLLALSYGALDEAKEWAQWTTDFNAHAIDKTQQKRLRFYHAVVAIINVLELDHPLCEYEAHFLKMFTQKDYDMALNHVQQQAHCYDLANINTLTEFHKHQALMETYQNLQSVKRNANKH